MRRLRWWAAVGWLVMVLACGVGGACLRPGDVDCQRQAAPAMTAVREVPTVRVLMTEAAGR